MSAQTTPFAPVSQDAPLGVLVGVDGSDQSISAARWAQREAWLRGEAERVAGEFGVTVDLAVRVSGDGVDTVQLYSLSLAFENAAASPSPGNWRRPTTSPSTLAA